MCGILCCQTALTRGVSSKYPHFCLCSLLPVNPERSRFRHLYVVHGLSYHLARLSLRLTLNLCGVVCNLLRHSLHRMILGGNSAGSTLRKKHPWISAFSLHQTTNHILNINPPLLSADTSIPISSSSGLATFPSTTSCKDNNTE